MDPDVHRNPPTPDDVQNAAEISAVAFFIVVHIQDTNEMKKHKLGIMMFRYPFACILSTVNTCGTILHRCAHPLCKPNEAIEIECYDVRLPFCLQIINSNLRSE